MTIIVFYAIIAYLFFDSFFFMEITLYFLFCFLFSNDDIDFLTFIVPLFFFSRAKQREVKDKLYFGLIKVDAIFCYDSI